MKSLKIMAGFTTEARMITNERVHISCPLDHCPTGVHNAKVKKTTSNGLDN